MSWRRAGWWSSPPVKIGVKIGRPKPPCSHTRVFLPNSCRSDSCPTRYLCPPRRDYGFHLRDWRYAAISLGAPVDVHIDTPPLKAIEPPPSAPPTPRRYAGGRREARPTHPSLVADGRHPPRERRAGTPSRGGAILGSLCPPNRQMACLSASYTARERFFLLSILPREINAIRPQAGRQFCWRKIDALRAQ